jgi:hypothetical protein
VPAAGAGIVELQWNPGAAAAGTRVFVLATCDHPTDRPLPLGTPPTFPSLADLDTFCERNPNAAYRELVIGP